MAHSAVLLLPLPLMVISFLYELFHLGIEYE